ncbi:MAG: hypothetical protein EOP09_11735, partial [Proteobacteria bacterium]
MKAFVRNALKVLGVIVVLDLIWFGATYSYINSDTFLEKINRPRLQFKVSEGYSPWPGYFRFSNFVFTGFSKQSTYQVKAESVSFRLNFLNLARRHVSINGLTGNNITISVAEGPESDKPSDVTDAEMREETAQRDAEKEARTGKEKKLWVTEFSGAELNGVKEIKLLDWLWKGDIDLDASFRT